MPTKHIESKKLQTLEESLWIAETRFDIEYMEKTLHPDFFEFGRSGRIYSRQNTLAVPAQDIKAKLPLRNFQIHPIAENIVQVTYGSEVWDKDEWQIGNRSSIWVKVNDDWKLRFHQGTVVNND